MKAPLVKAVAYINGISADYCFSVPESWRNDRYLEIGIILSAGVDNVLAVVVGVPLKRLEPALSDITAGNLNSQRLTLMPDAACRDYLYYDGDYLAGAEFLCVHISLDRVEVGRLLFVKAAAGDTHFAPGAGMRLVKDLSRNPLSCS